MRRDVVALFVAQCVHGEPRIAREQVSLSPVHLDIYSQMTQMDSEEETSLRRTDVVPGSDLQGGAFCG